MSTGAPRPDPQPRRRRRALIAAPLVAAALLAPASLAPAAEETESDAASGPMGRLAADARAALASLDTSARRLWLMTGFDRDALMRDLARTGQALGSEALAQWIWASRSEAMRDGVVPIPPTIRARLDGHFPAALLDKVRYRVSSSSEFALPAQAFRTNAVAITLGEVILFRPGAGGEADPRVWAHELTHVQQYDRWGVRGFAQRYTADHLAVEREAQDGAARYAAAVSAGSRGR